MARYGSKRWMLRPAPTGWTLYGVALLSEEGLTEEDFRMAFKELPWSRRIGG